MKKGFVLMETIVVIVVISVALLTIFSSYNKILSKVKKENKYDTSEYIYMTNYIKKYLKDKITNNELNISVTDICGESVSGDCTDNFTSSDYELSGKLDLKVKELYDVEKIYILTNLNKFDKEMVSPNNKKNSSFFDAYMIDYIRKLDVSDKDELIIVEYKRPAKNNDYSDKQEYSNDNTGNVLYETYISSLEW